MESAERPENQAGGEPLSHQGYEGETSVAREARLGLAKTVASAPYEKRNTMSGVDPYAPIAEAALRPTHTRCSVLGCCNHAGSGRIQAIMVCMPCAQTLNTGEPGRGSTFIHLLNETLKVTQRHARIEHARIEHATKLLQMAAKRRGVEISPGAFDAAMDALVVALREGAGPYREGLYGQAESEKSNAGVQSR